MISKELKSQLSILKETNPEYIQTLKDAVTASYKAELQAIKPISKVPQPRNKQKPPPLRTHKITDKRNITNPTKRYNHNRYNITTMNILYHILRGILSLITILTLIRNENIYQAYKHHHPTNKLRYIISQILILILYTSSLILLSYTYRYLIYHGYL